VIAPLVLLAVVAGTATPTSAQWFNYPTPRAPRTPSGEVDLWPSVAGEPNSLLARVLVGYMVRRHSGNRDDRISRLWIDWDGSVISEAAKVRERIRRPDFGHLEIEVTVDDPEAYTKPRTVTLRQQFIADTELIDEICAENEKDAQHLR